MLFEEFISTLAEEVAKRLNTKVDKKPGKVLSSNDFTDVLKNKLDGLENYVLPSDVVHTNDLVEYVEKVSGSVLESSTYEAGKLYYCTSNGDIVLSGKMYLAINDSNLVELNSNSINLNPSINTFTISPSTTEIGNEVSVTYSYALKKYSSFTNLAISINDNGTITNEAVSPISSSGSGTLSGTYDNTTFTLTGVVNGQTITKQAVLTPKFREFYGVVQGDTIAEVLANLKNVTSDTSSLKTTFSKPSTLTIGNVGNSASDSHYVYFITKSTISSVKSSGVDVPFTLLGTGSFVNSYDAAYTVNVYRTDNKLFGALNFDIS